MQPQKSWGRYLYGLVADCAATNASRAFENRRRISTTEIGRRIQSFLETSDPSAINHAFDSGALAPVDFVTQISEPGFYQGIKVRPGHLAAGLVLERPIETQAIVGKLKNQRHLLITGPSGAGKSALMWLSANHLNAEMRWYQVSDRAEVQHATSIVRTVRACHPTNIAPIGLAFNEVGPSNVGVWNILANELRELPHVHLLGTVRNEDTPLISNQPDTVFFKVVLSENLAQSVWQKLATQDQTEWQHWREPYELSEGLMLEYVHILTQGKRLAAVIGEQVRQRQQEGRHDELAILRGTSALSSLGGEVEASKLFEILELTPDCASVALQRLIDEHLVRESRPGVFGGLHALRSKALCEASHDEIAFLRADSLWHAFLAATNETLARIIHSVLKETQPLDEAEVVQRLADLLAINEDVEVWTGIVTGLGLGTLERRVASFVDILEQHGVQPGFWSAASLFAITDGDVPESTRPEVRRAIISFKTATHRDLRADCLALLPQGTQIPNSTNLRRANRLYSCLVPFNGGKPLPIKTAPNVSIDHDHDFRDVASFLLTAYAVDPELARNLLSQLGGEQTLLNQYHAQTPWMTAPEVDPNGEHGRTVRANWLYIDEEHQGDPHESSVAICTTLLALSPLSDAAASDAIDPSGQTVAMGNFRPWSKNIPRRNLFAEARVSWNVAFRQILLARAATDSMTDFSHQIADLVRRTEKAFRKFTERWLAADRISETLNAEIKEIVSEVSRLAYATPESAAFPLKSSADGTAAEDNLGRLLRDVLNNLLTRMKQIPISGNTTVADAKTAASFADSRSVQIQEQIGSDIWRTTTSSPRNNLKALAKRLSDVACVLHEIGYEAKADSKSDSVSILDSLPGKSVRAAARLCRQSADRRLSHRLCTVEKELDAQGWTATCWTRPTDKSKSAFWPVEEVAILVEIEGFDTDGAYLEDCLTIGHKHLDGDLQFRVAPVINGHVIQTFAIRPSSPRPMPDLEFESNWREQIDLPFLSSVLAPNAEAFDKAVGSCQRLSAIILSRDLENLFPEEDIVFSKAIDCFKSNHKAVDAFAVESGDDFVLLASVYLNDLWKRVVSESEAVQSGQTIENPFCMSPFHMMAGKENEEMVEFELLRMLLRQVECKLIAS